MKILNTLWPVLAALAIFSGCAGYQLASKNNTVVVENISPKTFTVNFCGNAHMTQKDVEKYSLQRASEVTLSKGYLYFSVVKKSDSSKVCMLNAEHNYNSTMDPQAQGASSNFGPFMEPNVTLDIRCYSKEDKMPDDAINAAQFLDENFPGLRK